MITEDNLRAAADTIDEMSQAELRRRFSQLKEARRGRTRRQILHQQAELDSMELDEAAYRLASQAENQGDLLTAARWYRAGAMNDFADAPLRLAGVFDALAQEQLAGAETEAATHDELHLVIQAARWYLVALAAGDIEADELLEILLARHDPNRPGTGSTPDPRPDRGRPTSYARPAVGFRPPEPRPRRPLPECGPAAHSRP